MYGKECGSAFSSRSLEGALRDDTKNGCVGDERKIASADYLVLWYCYSVYSTVKEINTIKGINTIFVFVVGEILAPVKSATCYGKYIHFLVQTNSLTNGFYMLVFWFNFTLGLIYRSLCL